MNVQENARTAETPDGFDWDTIKTIISGLGFGRP